MCGGTPKVQKQDPEKDAELAAARATQDASRELAQRKKRVRGSSLRTGGAQGVTGPVSTLRAGAYGKETLGE